MGAPAALADPDANFTTANPDLRSATVTDATVNDGTPNRVRYCFDQPLANVSTNSGAGTNYDYYLNGYDSDKALYLDGASGNPSGVVIDISNNNCVIVGFPDAVDITQFTIAGADRDVVRRVPNTVASGNAPDNITLTGSLVNTGAAAGRTEGPDLLSVELRPTTNEIDYLFDEQLQPGVCAFAGFRYYRQAAATAPVNGTACAVSQNRARVTFGPGVEQAVRAVVDRDAVRDTPTSSNGSFAITKVLSNPIGDSNAPTERPDMTTAERVSGSATQVDVTYDEDVSAPAGGLNAPASLLRFRLVGEDSRFLNPINVVLLPGARTLRLTFPNSTRVAVFDYPLVTVDAGGVVGSAQSELSTEGADDISTSAAKAGLTDGPDLLGTAVNTATDEVTFRFDENVDDTNPPAPGAFFSVDPNGNVSPAPAGSTVQATGNDTVVVRYAEDIDNRVAFGRAGPAPVPIRDFADGTPPESGGNSRNTATLAFASGVGGGTTATTTGTGTGTTGTGTTGTGTTGTGTTGTGTGTTGTGTTGTGTTGTGTTGTGTTGTTTTGTTTTTGSQITPNMLRPRGSARRRGRRVSGRVSGRMVGTQGRPCEGRVKVSIRFRGGRLTRTTRMGSNCRYSLRFSVRTRRVVRSLRVGARFQGNAGLLPDSSPTARVRVRRR